MRRRRRYALIFFRPAYVYRAPDRLFVNAEMIRSRHATTYRRFRFAHRDAFLALEGEHRAGDTDHTRR